MNFGLAIVLVAQFFSALGDNALLVAAIAALQQLSAPEEYVPILNQFFILAYIVLAPFVGPFADALPKGRVMFLSNNVKIVGCLAMLVGVHPLVAYGLVGVGAAAYSPAKYGILSEMLPAHKLVMANGWMEALTVLAIIMGAVLGGLLIDPRYALGLGEHFPLLRALPGGFGAAQFAILCCAVLYLLAAFSALYIPRLALDHKLPSKSLLYILKDFSHAFAQLWKDALGQVALAVTTLFWGASATLRLVVLAWAEAVLQYGLDKASQLIAVVALGVTFGSVIAAKLIKLEDSVRVLPVGIAMGVVVLVMAFIHDWTTAVILLMVIGTLGGLFLVPMNALLQHRGHRLMGAGHSIAVQNFNENLSILIMLGVYALMIRAGFTIQWIIVIFGLFISSSMAAIYRRHRRDVVA
jgi:MFS transporter, LPLT family, lysophospholipid transporter